MNEIEKLYNDNCYVCKNDETTWCDSCPVKLKILELEEKIRQQKNE